MKRFSRRRVMIIIAIVSGVFVIALATFLFLTQVQTLRDRSARITVGMRQQQVEAILGQPVLTLPRGPTGSGDVLVWVDQLWQFDVTIGPEGRVLRCRCVPSDSAVRRAQLWFRSLVQ